LGAKREVARDERVFDWRIQFVVIAGRVDRDCALYGFVSVGRIPDNVVSKVVLTNWRDEPSSMRAAERGREELTRTSIAIKKQGSCTTLSHSKILFPMTSTLSP